MRRAGDLRIDVALGSARKTYFNSLLGVTHLVRGSLQRQGERIRITVRLVDTGTRAQLWSDSYDVAVSDILATPDYITGAIVATLHNRVEKAALEESRRKPALAAYECVLRGIKHLRGLAPEDNRRASELFQQAMDLDPDPFIVNRAGQVTPGRADIPAADRSAERPIDKLGSEPMASD